MTRLQIHTRRRRHLASLFDKEKERLRAEAEAEGGVEQTKLPLRGVSVVDAKYDQPRQNWWYVYQMKLRFEWPKCEGRKTVIKIFQELWPSLAAKAEAFYDTAEADPRTAAELLEAYHWREKPRPQLVGEGGD